MSLATFLRRTANALSSFLFAAVAAAQTVHGSPAQPSTYPNSATEKAVQVINVGALTQINCTTNLGWLGCVGGPFTDGNMVLNGSSIAGGSVIGVDPSNGTAAALPGPTTNVVMTLCKQSGIVQASNTASETTVYDCTVPAGILNTAAMLKFHFVGDYTYNNNLADTLIIKYKYGCADNVAACAAGQVVFGDGAAVPDTTLVALKRSWVATVSLVALGSTTSQTIFGSVAFSGRDNSGTGTGAFGNNASSPAAGGPQTKGFRGADTTVNSANVSHFLMTAKWSTGAVGNVWRTIYAYAEYFPQ